MSTPGRPNNLSAERPPEAPSLAPWWGWALLALGGLLGLIGFVAVIVWGPIHLITQGRASDDAYLKAITDTRTALVQAVGGFAVFLGVLVGLFTLRHNRQQLRAGRQEHVESLEASKQSLQKTLDFNRESLDRSIAVTERGQITERFSKGIEQLGRVGADALDLRLGGIYALQQIARDSESWHNPVVKVLAAFVRQHASGQAEPEGDTMAKKRINLWSSPADERFALLSEDVAVAINVLANRDRTKDAARLDFSRADFRRVEFEAGLNLQKTAFLRTRMQFCRLGLADLRDSYFVVADLRGASLRQADLRQTNFYQTTLEGADLKNARLDGARFERCNLTGVQGLTIEQLRAAEVDELTQLPDDIDRALLKKPAEPETQLSQTPSE